MDQTQTYEVSSSSSSGFYIPTELGYRLDAQGSLVQILQGARALSPLKSIQTNSATHPIAYSMGTWGQPDVQTWSSLEALLLTYTNVPKNEVICTFTPPYAFVVCLETTSLHLSHFCHQNKTHQPFTSVKLAWHVLSYQTLSTNALRIIKPLQFKEC